MLNIESEPSASGGMPSQPPPRPSKPAPEGGATRTTIAEIDARLHAVEQLIKIFRLERYIYLSISIASFLVIVVFAAYIFASSNADGRNALFILLFAAPSGALLYVSAAFLKMWTQALQVLGAKGSE